MRIGVVCAFAVALCLSGGALAQSQSQFLQYQAGEPPPVPPAPILNQSPEIAQLQLQSEASAAAGEPQAQRSVEPSALANVPLPSPAREPAKERARPPKIRPVSRRSAAAEQKISLRTERAERAPAPQRSVVLAPQPQPPPVSAPSRSGNPTTSITLGDIGFVNGFRFANLGGQGELYVPLPQGDVAATALDLVFDDVSAHDAARNLQVQVNDRTVAAVVLDGKSPNRVLRVPLPAMRARNGFVKLAFLYSGAATIDRCIDVRAVGDVLTIRPETALEIDVGPVAKLDVATTAALMPRDVAVVLPPRPISATEIATALTVGRAILASGRHVTFYHGYDQVTALAKRDNDGRWNEGIVLVGPLADATGIIDAPIAVVAGEFRQFGLLDAVRVGGMPALLVSDSEAVRAGRLFGSPMLPATRGMTAATVGKSDPLALPDDRVTFDQLGIPADEVEVFGRANLSAVIDTRRLPAGTRPARLLLDVMVAPNGDGEKAVVSAFVNEHLLGSTVAATGEATHLDLALPDGLIGTLGDLRVVVERDSAQGNCRFEPQGYPAQILGSSALFLEKSGNTARDFADLTSHFARGFEVLLPARTADQPTRMLDLVAQAANQLSPETAPLEVSFVAAERTPVPTTAFIAVSDLAPEGTAPHVRFDRGRVAVIDRSGHTLLDLGGFADGAVAQVVSAGDTPGLWIHPMAAGGDLPSPPQLHLDHGDVAFVDDKGVALAMSTERDNVVKISYPDQVSWLTVAERFRSWIVAGFWVLGTAIMLLALQRMLRRRPAQSD